MCRHRRLHGLRRHGRAGHGAPEFQGPERDQRHVGAALAGASNPHSPVIPPLVFCFRFASLPIRARLANMDPRLVEAAADLYASPGQAFRRITLPLLMPGIISGAMLAFIVSLDDFVITFFVAGPGATTLPVYIFGMVRMGITPEVNALAALLLIASMVFVGLSWWIGQRDRR